MAAETDATSHAPRYSIVIPIHNEAECLEAEVAEIVDELEARGVDYELILAENGSSDDTLAIAAAAGGGQPAHPGHADARARLRLRHEDGHARRSAGDYVVQLRHRLPRRGLHAEGRRRAGQRRAGAPQGGTAPALPASWWAASSSQGSEDRRSPARHLVSLGFTTILRVLFDPRMDDTHGMKVLRREVVQRVRAQDGA